MTLTIAESSSAADEAASTKPATTSGVAGRTSAAAVARGHLVQPILESRDHAEVAPAAADRPEQVGVVLLVRSKHFAVRGDDVCRQQRVDRETVLAHEVADASAERDAADPHGRGVAEADDESLGLGTPRHLARSQPGLGPDPSLLGVELERLPVAEVEQDAAVALHCVPRSCARHS